MFPSIQYIQSEKHTVASVNRINSPEVLLCNTEGLVCGIHGGLLAQTKYSFLDHVFIII